MNPRSAHPGAAPPGAEAAAPLLAVRGLSHAYGGVVALDGVSFDLQAGRMLALIGPNGAGKSTCFNALGGQLRPARGSMRLDGRELAGLPAQRIWRLGVGRTFQTAAAFRSMTALENVQVALLSHDRRLFDPWSRAGRHRPGPAAELLAQVGMQAQAGRLCSELTYGDLKRVELAMALAHRPRLLLMDEPTAGMGAGERRALMRLVRSLADDRGLAVLFTEHSLDVVFAHADHIVVLVRGRVLAAGAPHEIAGDPRVRAAYLGDAPMPGPARAPSVDLPAPA